MGDEPIPGGIQLQAGLDGDPVLLCLAPGRGSDTGESQEELIPFSHPTRVGWKQGKSRTSTGKPRPNSLLAPPPCTGLHPEEEEGWHCCSAALPSHGLALNTQSWELPKSSLGLLAGLLL